MTDKWRKLVMDIKVVLLGYLKTNIETILNFNYCG